MNTDSETREFKAELKQLLHLITHALYSNREIFLRELVSNASDAINKARFNSLDNQDLLEGDTDWKIRIVPDTEAGTLTISDNGIGMGRDAITEDLGTIARSGTRAFLETLRQANTADRPGLIGQFGVGFYSAFMVADRVTVRSRAAGLSPSDGVLWESDGQGEFSVADAEKTTRGTEVTLHLKADAREYLDAFALRALIKKFSDFVEFPIVLVTKKGDGQSDEEQVNTRKAIWLRNKAEVKPEEYAEFFQQLAGDSGEPARVIHYSVEGQQEFRVLAFVPSRKPLWFDWEESKPGLKLYAQRVLIMDPCEELVPPYLRFVKGVLDSSDLPLNISRELLQQNALLQGMRKSVVKNVLDALHAMKNAEAEPYAAFFRDFGPMLKEGVARDWENRDRLAELLLVETADRPAGELISLSKYVEAMPEGQDAIYYLVGDNAEMMRHSPYLEPFRARGWDVVLLPDPYIDEFFIPHLTTFQEKSLKPIDRTEIPGGEEVEGASEFDGLLKAIRERLPEVKDVRLSKRLTESASCLAGDASALPPHMARLMERMGQSPDPDASKRTLELNPKHPAVLAVRELMARSPQDDRIDDYARLLYEQALIAEGSKLPDPTAFARRLNALLTKDASTGG